MASFLVSLIDQALSNLCFQLARFGSYCHQTITSPTKKPKPSEAAAKPDASLNKRCRFRLDTDSSATFTLPDGRDLGYAQYGSLTGKAVFYLHGLPGSRLEAALWEVLAIQLDIRMISVDRPGIGMSSPHPDRTLLDHPKDVEHLAEHLEVNEYGVMGISGGGPYALACAASLPADKLKTVLIICGLGLPDMSRRGMCWANWAGFTLGWPYFPRSSAWYLSREAGGRLDLSDEQRMDLMKKQFVAGNSDPKDREVFGNEDFMRLCLRAAREHYSQGIDALAQDGQVLCADPGFRIEDIRRDLPIQLWYGEHDANVSLLHGQLIADRLGEKGQLHVVDETHASIVWNCRDEIMRDLLSKLSA